MNYQSWIPYIIEIAKEASHAIKKIYHQKSYSIQSKLDKSPVTEADLLSNSIIQHGLQQLEPSFPIISEEGDEVPFSERSKWTRYFLVDPLDGTQEFINGNNEFSVNIALVENNKPILGVVAVPFFERVYWGYHEEDAAYLQEGESPPTPIHSRSTMQYPIKVVMSRRHKEEEHWKEFLKRLPEYEVSYFGSALKICLVAEGKADLYPRFGKTGEWDTAAGQCILEAAGGKVIDLQGNPLKYNMRPSLINPSFYAVGSPDLFSYIKEP